MSKSLPSARKTVILTSILASISGITICVWGFSAAANASDRNSIPDDFAVVNTDPEPPPSDLTLPDLGVGGIEDSSLQSLGSTDVYGFYLGVDSVNNLCLVAFDTKARASASSCVAPQQLEKAPDPLGVGLWTIETGGVEAYLLPDDYRIKELPTGWVQVSKNVIAVDADTANSEPAVVALPDGTSISVARQSGPDSIQTPGTPGQ